MTADMHAEIDRLRDELADAREVLRGMDEIVARLRREKAELVEALKHSLAGHYATWMASRAEVEGGRTSHDLFQREPEVIEAYAALRSATEKDEPT